MNKNEGIWERAIQLKNSENWKIRNQITVLEIEIAEAPHKKEILQLEIERLNIQLSENQ